MILFVDDERRYVDNIIEELQLLGVKLKFCSDVDSALDVLQDNEIEGLVCDVMLPHGRAFSSGDTEENRTTGTLLLKLIRQKGNMIPVVLLTSVESNYRHNPQIEAAAKANPPCLIIRKRRHAAFEVAKMIVEFFKNHD